jgi:hypothetical protein
MPGTRPVQHAGTGLVVTLWERLEGPDRAPTFYSVESACINMALFTTIAKAAGKDLTVASFERAGYGLRNATMARRS